MSAIKMSIGVAFLVMSLFLAEGTNNVTYASQPCTTYPPDPVHECVDYHQVPQSTITFKWSEHGREVKKFKWTLYDTDSNYDILCSKDWHEPDSNGYGEKACDLNSVASGHLLEAVLEYELTNGIADKTSSYYEIE